MREQLIRQVEMIPVEVVVRNVAAGSLCTRLGLEEGMELSRSIVEFYYKDDALNDPLVSEEHITALGWAIPPEIDEMMALSLRVRRLHKRLVRRCRNSVGRFQARIWPRV